MSIEYQNDSDKEIAAVKFKVLFVDAVGDSHNPFQTYTTEKRIAPGKRAKSKWKNDYYPNYRKMEVTVVKVRFVDGSTWQAEED